MRSCMSSIRTKGSFVGGRLVEIIEASPRLSKGIDVAAVTLPIHVRKGHTLWGRMRGWTSMVWSEMTPLLEYKVMPTCCDRSKALQT